MESESASLLEAYREAFDEGRYWEAHEGLEEYWRTDRQAVWQALIQIAAAFVQIQKGHWGGAARVLRRALTRLDAAPATLPGIDVGGLRQRIRPLVVHLERLQHDPNGRFDEHLRLRMAEFLERR